MEVELDDLYSSPNIVRVTKLRRKRLTGHLARIGRGVVYTGFLCWNLGEREHLEDPREDGRIILRWIFRKWVGGMDWIDVAQYRDRWRALVNAVMKHWVPQNAENFLISWERVSFSGRTAPLVIKLVSVNVNRKVHMNVCLILNGYGDRAARIWYLNPLHFCLGRAVA